MKSVAEKSNRAGSFLRPSLRLFVAKFLRYLQSLDCRFAVLGSPWLRGKIRLEYSSLDRAPFPVRVCSAMKPHPSLLGVAVVTAALACLTALPSILSGAEKAALVSSTTQPISLFNGKDLTGWSTFLDPRKE